MKLEVIKNGYYVNEDLTNLGIVDEDRFELSYSKLLCIGDVWEKDLEYDESGNYFKCIKGKWLDAINDGWWEYIGFEDYFKVIE